MKIKISQTELEAFSFLVESKPPEERKVYKEALWNVMCEFDKIPDRSKFLHALIVSENREVTDLLRNLVRQFIKKRF